MGELMDVLRIRALSSDELGPRRTIGAKPLKSEAKPEATTEAGVRPHNEVLFLLQSAGVRDPAPGSGADVSRRRVEAESLRRFRERVLRVASRALRQGRRC